MNKLSALVSVLAIAGAALTASAADREGKLGLGYQETFSSNVVGSPATANMGSWSLKYGMSSAANLQAVVGFNMGKNISPKTFNVGARFLYDLVENENSDFYTGIGVLYNRANSAATSDAVRVNIPLGFEFSFAGLPEVGVSAEAGLSVDFQTEGGAKAIAISSVGGNVGGNLGLGIDYYF